MPPYRNLLRERPASNDPASTTMTPAEVWNSIVEAIRQLFNTPMSGWTWLQWFLAFVLLSAISSCCGCGFRCCGRGGRRRRGYRSSNNIGPTDRYYSATHRANNNSSSGSSVDANNVGGGSCELPEQDLRAREKETPVSTPYRRVADV